MIEDAKSRPRHIRSTTLLKLLVGLVFISGMTSAIVIYYCGRDSRIISMSVTSNLYVWNNSMNMATVSSPFYTNVHFDYTQHLKQYQEGRFVILDWSGYKTDKNEDRFIGSCFVTRNKDFLNFSDAVVITNRKQYYFHDFPKYRHRWQRWVWLQDESPFHAFNGNDFSSYDLRTLFNWTMTYRTNSDVYIPYGWTVRKAKAELIPDFIGKQSKLAVVVMSNCDPEYVHNGRYNYVQHLQQYVQVDVFGACSEIPCEGYNDNQMTGSCPKVKEYLFYLAFENSNCPEYVTEKAFSHGFDMGTVPVVMGASKEDYASITPPNSFIYVNDFQSPEHLAHYLKTLEQNRSQYMEFHEWRRDFTNLYRIQYLNDEILWESLCNALESSKGEVKTYADLEQYWTMNDCEPHRD